MGECEARMGYRKFVGKSDAEVKGGMSNYTVMKKNIRSHPCATPCDRGPEIHDRDPMPEFRCVEPGRFQCEGLDCDGLPTALAALAFSGSNKAKATGSHPAGRQRGLKTNQGNSWALARALSSPNGREPLGRVGDQLGVSSLLKIAREQTLQNAPVAIMGSCVSGHEPA